MGSKNWRCDDCGRYKRTELEMILHGNIWHLGNFVYVDERD